MSLKIENAVVIGSGVMGAGIAAHLANCGIEVLLLDILPPELSASDREKGLTETSPEWRNKLSISALNRLLASRRPVFTSEESFARVKVGNLEDDLSEIAGYDWILETIIEKLEIKRPLFARIEKLRRPDSIVTTNTSGLPIKQITAGMTREFRQYFMGTHFFNPPTYIRLLEIIPGEETLTEAVEFMKSFCTERLSKDVLICKDTPNFIANRMGCATSLNAMHLAARMGMRVEEVDALCGHAMARLRTAVFRSSDAIGLDTNYNVVRNLYANVPDDERRDLFRYPPYAELMIERGMLGAKTGKGYYKTEIAADGSVKEMVLDLDTLEYRDAITPDFPCLLAAQKLENPADRLRVLVSDKNDRGSLFAWEVVASDLIYAANRVLEICDTIMDIDNAMKWGYFWRLSPFEAWDSLGVKETVARMKEEGKPVPQRIETMLAKGCDSFYKEIDGIRCYYDFRTESYQPIND
ncbi:MAG: 3-hydroxyacyl-CoA dehydrogenase family protein [Bacillota bacterium]